MPALTPSPTIGLNIGFSPEPFINPNIISNIKGMSLQTVEITCTAPPTPEPSAFNIIIIITIAIVTAGVKAGFPVNNSNCCAQITESAAIIAG